jgi:hypothetical protein
MRFSFAAYLLFALLSAVSTAGSNNIKIACSGASITYGATLKSPEQDSYPGQLQIMLGSNLKRRGFISRSQKVDFINVHGIRNLSIALIIMIITTLFFDE